MEIRAEIQAFYGLGEEAGRLDESYFPLERARTEELLGRYLPPAPAVILDVGGGAGAYALPLAGRGYEVHLLDPVPLHIEQARQAAAQAARPLASASVGDARRLERPAASADAVLLLGPLYHLVAREERLLALREAHRVLCPGGYLFAAAISRFASLIEGLRGLLFEDPEFEHIVRRDLATGEHRNHTDNPRYFTTAYFHRVEELGAEVQEAGFEETDVFGIEGPGALLQGFRERWQDGASRRTLLDLVRAVEREPSLRGLSPHLLAVAKRRMA